MRVIGLLLAVGLALAPRIGILRTDTPLASAAGLNLFRQGLADLRYVEGQDYVIEARWAEGQLDRLPRLAAELVHVGVDVIVTHGPPAIRAARDATTTIPIVTSRMDDADAHGFVASLAAPAAISRGSPSRAASSAPSGSNSSAKRSRDSLVWPSFLGLDRHETAGHDRQGGRARDGRADARARGPAPR
jgi:hypothetical protein